MKAVLDVVAAERARTTSTSPHVPTAAALIASAVVVAWGNGLVLAARDAAPHGEAVTLAGQLVFVPAAVLIALWAGRLTRAELGFRLPRRAPGFPVVVVAALVVVAGTAVALVRAGRCDDAVGLVRLLVGTAVGEEVLFRGVLFALWARTSVNTTVLVAVHAASFVLWHVAGAAPLELLGPTAGGVFFLWARCRYGSVAAPAALHAAMNLPGWVASHCW